MKTDLTHLPLLKQQELTKIIDLICVHTEVEMLILFGSYARGDWRETLSEDGVYFIYQSDLDLLIVVETPSTSKQNRLEREIKKDIDQIATIQTPVSLIVHDIDFINRRLKKAQYFFNDIKKEGILLYDSGRFELKEARELSPVERKKLAEEDFEYWFSGAKRFFETFKIKLEKGYYSDAAFELHQVSERLYSAILLVFTRYKPNTHSLEMLRKLVNALDPRFIKIFPLTTNKEKYYFKLLCNAYVEARYKPSYAITPEELFWLSEQVKELIMLTHELCQEKINLFAQGSE